jgi:hypothetical protein
MASESPQRRMTASLVVVAAASTGETKKSTSLRFIEELEGRTSRGSAASGILERS